VLFARQAKCPHLYMTRKCLHPARCSGVQLEQKRFLGQYRCMDDSYALFFWLKKRFMASATTTLIGLRSLNASLRSFSYGAGGILTILDGKLFFVIDASPVCG